MIVFDRSLDFLLGWGMLQLHDFMGIHQNYPHQPPPSINPFCVPSIWIYYPFCLVRAAVTSGFFGPDEEVFWKRTIYADHTCEYRNDDPTRASVTSFTNILDDIPGWKGFFYTPCIQVQSVYTYCIVLNVLWHAGKQSVVYSIVLQIAIVIVDTRHVVLKFHLPQLSTMEHNIWYVTFSQDFRYMVI